MDLRRCDLVRHKGDGGRALPGDTRSEEPDVLARFQIVEEPLQERLLRTMQELAHAFWSALRVRAAMMRVQSVEIFGDAAGSRDLRVIGSRRHQPLGDLRGIEVMPLVAQSLDQRLAHDHYALMGSEGLVE